jgi:hypothetical protein
VQPKYELTDEDVELASEIAHQVRSLYEATVQVLAKTGWQQDFMTGEWRIEQRCEGEFGQELRRPIAITHFALEYMAEHGLDALLPQLERMFCAREAALIGYTWLKMPSFVKEGRCNSVQGMELEILRLLMTPRKDRP